MQKRGVVIAGLLDAHEDDLETSIKIVDLDEGFLKNALLYWDRIDIPEQEIVSAVLPSEFKVLKDENILTMHPLAGGRKSNVLQFGAFGGLDFTMTNVSFGDEDGQTLDMVKLLNEAPMIAFNKLSQMGDVLWSYLRHSRTAVLPAHGKKNPSFLIQIQDAFPAISADMPVEKILEFKNLRFDELNALRLEVDAIQDRLSRVNDLGFEEAFALERIHKSLSDLRKAAEEQGIKRRLPKFSFDVDLARTSNYNTAAEVIGFLTNPSNAIAIKKMFALASLVKVEWPTADRKLPQRLTPYQYLLTIEDRLIF